MTFVHVDSALIGSLVQAESKNLLLLFQSPLVIRSLLSARINRELLIKEKSGCPPLYVLNLLGPSPDQCLNLHVFVLKNPLLKLIKLTMWGETGRVSPIDRAGTKEKLSNAVRKREVQ